MTPVIPVPPATTGSEARYRLVYFSSRLYNKPADVTLHWDSRLISELTVFHELDLPPNMDLTMYIAEAYPNVVKERAAEYIAKQRRKRSFWRNKGLEW